MPNSKKRRKNGKIKSGKQQKLTKNDILRRRNAVFTKRAEYGAMEYDELIELHKSGTVGGIYLVALEEVIAFKHMSKQRAEKDE